MSTNKSFSDVLRELMKSNGLSVRKLASLASMSPTTIQRLLHGKGTPQLATVKTLANIFEIDEIQLLRPASTGTSDIRSEDDAEGLPSLFGAPPIPRIPNEIPIFSFSLTEEYFSNPEFKCDETISAPPDLQFVPSPVAPLFAVYNETSAMAPALMDGDVLYFKKNGTQVKSGQVVIGASDVGPLTIGRLKRGPSEMFLSFDNNTEFDLPDIKIQKVLAVCVGLYRPFF